MRPFFLFIPAICFAQEVQLKNINSADVFALIKSYQNKKAVVVNYWATWCAPCVEEFPNFVRLRNENKESIEVIFVSFDLPSKRADVIHFLNEHNVYWPSYFKTEADDEFIQNMPEVWDGALPFSMIFRTDGINEIYLTGKQDFNTLIKYSKRAINNGVSK